MYIRKSFLKGIVLILGIAVLLVLVLAINLAARLAKTKLKQKQ